MGRVGSDIAGAITLAAVLIRRPSPSSAASRSGAFWAFAVFVGWVAIQSFSWRRPDSDAHHGLLEIYAKFLVVWFLIWRAIDSEENLRRFLWMQTCRAVCTWGGSRIRRTAAVVTRYSARDYEKRTPLPSNW